MSSPFVDDNSPHPSSPVARRGLMEPPSFFSEPRRYFFDDTDVSLSRPDTPDAGEGVDSPAAPLTPSSFLRTLSIPASAAVETVSAIVVRPLLWGRLLAEKGRTHMKVQAHANYALTARPPPMHHLILPRSNFSGLEWPVPRLSTPPTICKAVSGIS